MAEGELLVFLFLAEALAAMSVSPPMAAHAWPGRSHLEGLLVCRGIAGSPHQLSNDHMAPWHPF